MHRPLILIVDDESKIRRLLAQNLELEGFDVQTASYSDKEILKTVPPLGFCSAQIFPPWAAMIPRQIERPNPVPPTFRPEPIST